jgi:predicted DNA-binding transcriptional regulator YafY
MAKSDRLFRLLTALRMLPHPVTAARLAEDMGVSERTIYRDIDSLRAGGALIDGEAGVGYRCSPG